MGYFSFFLPHLPYGGCGLCLAALTRPQGRFGICADETSWAFCPFSKNIAELLDHRCGGRSLPCIWLEARKELS
jgi:hypothetical protein